MRQKVLVVAKEKHLVAIQDIVEAARRIGCEIRWLEPWEEAPSGSRAFYTKSGKGKWARQARQRIMVKKSFNECTFQQLVERVRIIIFPNHVAKSEDRIARLERAWSHRGD